MIVVVNGKEQCIPAQANLSSVIAEICGKPENVVAAVNGNISKLEEYDAIILNEGDVVDIMTFVGGG